MKNNSENCVQAQRSGIKTKHVFLKEEQVFLKKEVSETIEAFEDIAEWFPTDFNWVSARIL